MKRYNFLTLSMLLLFSGISFSQDTWQQKANFIGQRGAAFSFTINDKGYVGTGYDDNANYFQDNWAFDPVNNTWTQQADFPGGARYGAVGFSIGSMGYVGTGVGPGANFYNDLWAFDPAANAWTQKEYFPGTPRYFAVGFSINGAGYLGTGSQLGNYFNDLWEYNVGHDAWMQKTDMPTTGRHMAVAFTIDNKAYVGTGMLADDSRQKDLWQYDAMGDSWTQKTDLPGSERYAASAFAIGNRGYVASGFLYAGLQDVWEYYPENDSWTQRASISTAGRAQAVAFSINNKGYFGTGSDGSQFNNDFYEYQPINLNGDWTQLADFPTGWRYGAVAVGVGNKGYLALGASEPGYQKDMWEFDPATEVWTQKSDFPGTERQAGVAFAIGYKVYVGTGINNYTAFRDFYEFDPAQNLWKRIADYPGGVRYAAMSFSIGNKGYVGCGKDQNFYSGNKDFYEYDPATDIWTKKADVGTVMRSTGVGFSVGNKGYIGMGYEGYGTGMKDLWEFDPNDGPDGSWTQKQDLPAETRATGVAFGIGNKGYIVAGLWGVNLNDMWSYEPATGLWKEETIFPTAGRGQGIGFVVGNSGYFGLGYNYGNQLADLWKFSPPVPCDAWTQLADFPGVKRAGASAFSIGNKGYIAVGSGPTGLLNDTWEFDPAVKYWTQKADFPGIPRHTAFSFVIGSKGYVGTGINMYTAYSDFYEFDPSLNAWTQKADYPPGPRYIAMAFSIGNKGYAGCGKDQGLTLGTSDFYEYDPATNMWTRKADVGTVLRSTGVGFSIGNKGYIGLGAHAYDDRKKDMWEFDPMVGDSGTWTQKKDFAGQERHAAVAFTIGNRAYIGSGYYYSILNDMYAYDPVTDTYEPISTFPTLGRGAPMAFSIGTKGYFGTGDMGEYTNDFWEYNACYVPVKPTLGCVEDRIVFSTAESCSQIVADLDPIILPQGTTAVVNYTISRNGEIVSSGTGSVSGLTFLQGVNSVTYSLPEYPSQVCSFTVYVVDTVSPVVVCPPAQTICYNASNNYAIPSLIATDNCTITSITYEITGATTRSGVGIDASGLFNPGMHVITWTVTDIGANIVVCSMNVRIDNPLVVSIPDVSVILLGGRPNTIYRGFGLQCAVLTANPSGGTKYPGVNQYRYLWSNGATTKSIVVCPTTFGANNYTVTVTDSLGCSVAVTKRIQLVDVRCGPKNNEVLICWNRKTQSCYTQGQAFFALLIGAQLGSCSPAPAQATIVQGVTADPMDRFEKTITVIPNPNSGTFYIHLKNINTAEIRIVDQQGRVIARQAVNGMNKTQTIAMNISNLAKGMYMVQAVGKDGVETAKMVVQ